MESKIICGDALSILPELPKSEFRLCLTDPPFNISRDNNYKTMGRNGIDFGDWDKDFDQYTWIKLVEPLLKPWASIVIWNDWKKLGDIANFLTTLHFSIKTILTWHKGNPAPFNCKRRFLQSTEHAVWAVKQGKKNESWVFNSKYHHGFFEHSVCQSEHPTKKPTQIFKQLIEILSLPQDWILDPFVGSGTTALACLGTNRNYTCIEKDENYYNLAKEEIDNAVRNI